MKLLIILLICPYSVSKIYLVYVNRFAAAAFNQDIQLLTIDMEQNLMNTQLRGTFGSILIALTVAVVSTNAEAGKGNGGSAGQGYGSGNGAMVGAGPITGNGYTTNNSNQYRYQHQYQHREGKSNGNWTMDSADSGKGQYSDDRYLNQEDFQAWLNQNQNETKKQTQNRNQVETIARDAF